MRHYLRHLDYLMLATVLAISSFGLWIIENATRHDIPGQPRYYFARQLVYVAAGVVGLVLVSAIPLSWLRRMRWPLYGFVLATTAGVLLIGTTVRGGTRWISFGAFQFQPSEFAKLGLILGLAGLLCTRRGNGAEGRTTWLSLAYIGLPALLVFVEPDFGTTLVFIAIVLGMLFVMGTPIRHFVWMGLGTVVALALVFSILPGAGIRVLQPYQTARLTAFLHPDNIDPQDAGYHITQSKIAIGHGGLDGTGVVAATQTQLRYLPEHATDFIFAVVGEERGFVGAAWLIGLYALLVWRGLKVITRSQSTFASLVAAGIVSMLLFQIFVNIGMTIGIAPITGIPLPFMSFGGSHTVTNLLAIGVLQAIHVHARTPNESTRRPRLA